MKRWPLRRAFWIAAGTLAVVALARPWSPALTGYTARRLSQALAREVTIGRVQTHFFPPELELNEVRIASPQAGAPPLFTASRVILRPSPLSLFATRTVLSRVRLEKPVLHMAAFADGTSNLPAAGDGSAGRGEVRIRRFIVEGGEIVVDHERIPLDLDLPDLQARLTSRRDGGVGGPVSFAPGTLRFGKAPVLPFGLSANIEWRGRRVGLTDGKLAARDTALDLSGELFLEGGIRGLLSLRGRVDVGELDQHVFRTGLNLRGRGTWNGRTTIDGSTIRFEGRLDARDGAFDGVAVERCAMDVDWDGTDLRLRRLAAAALGGTGELEVDVPTNRSGDVRIAGTLAGVDAENLLSYVFRTGRPGLAAAATGAIDVSWPKGRARLVSGRALLDLAASTRSDGRTPLAGRVDWRAEKGVQTFTALDLRTPTTTLRAAGRIEADDRAALDVDLAASDLAAADDLGARVRRALGNAQASPVGFSGRGTFAGRMRGTISNPIFDGRFTAPAVAYLGVSWGAAEWDGELDGAELRSRSLLARRGTASLRLAGRMQTGDTGQADAMDLKVSLDQWPAEDFVKALDWQLAATGDLSGDFTLSDRRSAPGGGGRVAAKSGTFHGHALRGSRHRPCLSRQHHGGARRDREGGRRRRGIRRKHDRRRVLRRPLDREERGGRTAAAGTGRRAGPRRAHLGRGHAARPARAARAARQPAFAAALPRRRGARRPGCVVHRRRQRRGAGHRGQPLAALRRDGQRRRSPPPRPTTASCAWRSATPTSIHTCARWRLRCRRRCGWWRPAASRFAVRSQRPKRCRPTSKPRASTRCCPNTR